MGLKEVKTEIRDLGNKMDRKFDRLLYVALVGLVGLLAKGGWITTSWKRSSRSALRKRRHIGLEALKVVLE
jgi:hypothetical protein